jgi:uncharacterized protein YjbJ (UPF0337 family)
MTDQTAGAVKSAIGEVQDAVGGLAGDATTQIKGKLNEAAGSVQSAYGNAKDAVRERPMTGVAIGVALGFLLAHILGSQKTIYIRERRRSTD